MGINELIQIGDYLKKIRLDNNLTQEEFAQRLDLKRSTYSNYEKNNREPSKETLEKISKEFNVDLLELITSFPSVKPDKEAKPSSDTKKSFSDFLVSSLIDVKLKGKQIPHISEEDYNYLLNHCFSFIKDFYNYRYTDKNINDSLIETGKHGVPEHIILNKFINDSLDNLYKK